MNTLYLFQKLIHNVNVKTFKFFFPYFFFSLCVITLSLAYLFFSEQSSKKLIVSFLNIGQGDAIFIQAPNGAQVLLDGGPDNKVLSELGKIIPFYDKTIDAIIVSNPDKDHIAGFVDVLKRFKVDFEIEPGTISKTNIYQALKEGVLKEGSQKIVAQRGMDILLDKKNNVYIQILFPDKDVSKLSTNDGSIIAKLVYGNTSVLLQGDAPQKSEKYILGLNKEILNADILKVGHHGSRTSTARGYVEAVSPQYAVISLGKENRYGHPHTETLETLNVLDVPILRTDIDGRITFVSDGKKFWRE